MNKWNFRWEGRYRWNLLDRQPCKPVKIRLRRRKILSKIWSKLLLS